MARQIEDHYQATVQWQIHVVAFSISTIPGVGPAKNNPKKRWLPIYPDYSLASTSADHEHDRKCFAAHYPRHGKITETHRGGTAPFFQNPRDEWTSIPNRRKTVKRTFVGTWIDCSKIWNRTCSKRLESPSGNLYTHRKTQVLQILSSDSFMHWFT